MTFIPDALIRLISQYLCPFGSSNLINELLEYDENKIMNKSISFYIMDNLMISPPLNSDMQQTFTTYNENNIDTMFIHLIDFYNSSTNVNLLMYLSKYFNNMTIADACYLTEGLNINLLDHIVLYACVKKNKIFLDDFISANKNIRVGFLKRSDFNGERIYVISVYDVALKNLISISLLREDIDTVKFIINHFGFVCRSRSLDLCMGNMTPYVNCSKSLQFMKKWCDNIDRGIPNIV